jgi:hypothetical protein
MLMILGLYILLWGKNKDASVVVAAKEEEHDKEKQANSLGTRTGTIDCET